MINVDGTVEPDDMEIEEPVVETPKLFNFQEVLPRLTKMIGDWEPEVRETMRRRKMRKLDVDLDALRQEGKLKADETFIPIRVIDTNIKQEQPPFNSYLTQSRRLVIYEPLNVPKGTIDTQLLEMEFTKGMTYVGWQEPFFDVVDGSQLHGWNFVEIELDETRPYKVNINFLAHEDVIFPVDARDIEACEIVVVAYNFTALKLQSFIDRGYFDEEQGQHILDRYVDKAAKEDATFKIYKMFCKYKGDVYVSWFSKADCDDWLKVPEKLFLGRRRQEMTWQDVPVSSVDPMTGMPVSINIKQQVPTWVDITEILYPLKLLRYQKTEEAEVTETKGRAWLDSSKQEFATCMYSNFANGSARASNVYASPEQPSGSGKPFRLELELEPGGIYSEPMKFWAPTMPSFDLIKAAQALDTQTQIETGRVAFAAINNQDSRKTAKEIGVAQQQNALLNSVQVTLFSIFLCDVWNHVWSIVQSLALQGEIPFMPQGPKDPTTGKYLNDSAMLSIDYKLKPSGDVDVIERAENEQKREKMWPLIMQIPQLVMNPLAIMFVKDLIEETFPEDSAEYNQIIDKMVVYGQQMQMMQMQQGMMGQGGQVQQPQQKEQQV